MGSCANMVVKQRLIFALGISTLTIISAKLSDWPTEKMAKILTITCWGNEKCTEEFFLDILNKCVKTEIETEDFMDAIGSTTPFRRSTEYSKKLSKDFMISMRMKKALNNLSLTRKMRSYHDADKIIDSFCDQ